MLSDVGLGFGRQDLRPPENGVERRAQLVAQHRQELVFHAAGVLRLLARALFCLQRLLERLVRLAADAREIQVRFDARQQFARGERLDEIVVGAGAASFDARLFAGTRREQHDRHRARRRRCGARAAGRSRRAPASSRRRGRDPAGGGARPRARPLRRRRRRRRTARAAAARRSRACRRCRRRGGCGPRGIPAARPRHAGDRSMTSLVDRASRPRPPATSASPLRRTAVAPSAVAANADRADRSAGKCATPVGIVTVNVVPAPGWLATSTVPPCSLTSSCTSASPMPVPSCVRAVPSTRWKRSNTCGSSSRECRRRCRPPSADRHRPSCRATP